MKKVLTILFLSTILNLQVQSGNPYVNEITKKRTEANFNFKYPHYKPFPDTVVNLNNKYFKVNGCPSDFYFRVFGNLTEGYASNYGINDRWDFGDGQRESSQITYHTYKTSGVYNFCYIKYCTSADSSKTCYTIDNRCRAQFEYTFDASDKLKATFTNKSTGNNGVKYYWDFGDNTYSTLANPTHTYSKAGFYNVGLLTEDPNSYCHDSLGKTLTVGNPPCDTSFEYSQNYSDRIYYNTHFNKANLKWDFGDGTTSTDQYGEHQFFSLGAFNVCMSYECYTKDIIKVCKKVEVKCRAHFTKVLDSTQKFSIILLNNSTKGSKNYWWQFGDNTYSNEEYPSHKYSKFGKFKVCLNISGNCSSSFCDSIGMDSTGKLLKSDLWEIVVKEGPVGLKSMPKTYFKIYPNPANDKISIELENILRYYDKLEIINDIGQVCWFQSLEPESKTIEVNIARLNPGLYVIKLSNCNEHTYSKIIKN